MTPIQKLELIAELILVCLIGYEIVVHVEDIARYILTDIATHATTQWWRDAMPPQTYLM